MNESFNNEFLPVGLAEELESLGLLQDERKLRAFSCACCRLIWDDLPEAAQTALNVAEDFSKGLVSTENLVSERVKLWKQLGGESCNFASSSVNAVRATICCLFEHVPAHEAYDHVRATMDFCNAVADHAPEQYKLLDELFGKRSLPK